MTRRFAVLVSEVSVRVIRMKRLPSNLEILGLA